MSATRTQIYLTPEQRSRIDLLAAAKGTTLAEIVRRALDMYLSHEQPDPSAALTATFGADPSITAPSRDEWDRG